MSQVFKRAAAVERKRLGSSLSVHLDGLFTEANAEKQNTGQYEDTPDMFSPDADGKSCLERMRMRRVYKTETRFDFSDGNVVERMKELHAEGKFRNSVEAQAVFARGREEDNRRLRLTIAQLERQVWEAENALERSNAALKASESDLQEAESVIDDLQHENSSLRAQFDDKDRSSDEEGDGDDDDAGRHGCGVGDEKTKQAEASNGGRGRKAEQSRKARELVAGGTMLTRQNIGKLNKAEARAFLASMRKAPVRGNRPELIARLARIFEANCIDTYRTGDLLSSFPEPERAPHVGFASATLCVPMLPSVEDPGAQAID